MNLDLPVPTVTLGPAWAQQLNTAIEFIDAHDHTTGKGQLITSAAININDDLSFNNYKIEAAKILGMQNQASPLTDTRALYSVNGELYYTDGVGNQIALTAGGALNASSVGGIGGDYGSSTANVYYNSISKTFVFDQNVDQRAKLDIGDLLIRETVVGANAITIKSPTSLASAYELTLPTALPASTLPLLVSNTGVVSHQQLESAHLADDSVITDKIADLQVTNAKIAEDTIEASKIAASANIVTMYKTSITSGSGSWSKPSDLVGNFCIVRAFGGGGGGGGGNGGASGRGGGGGAGAQPRVGCIDLTGVSSVSYSVGTGGTGAGLGTGGAGNDGGNTSFGNLISYGGKGAPGGAVTGGSGPAVSSYLTMLQASVPGGNGGNDGSQNGFTGRASEFAAGGAGGGLQASAGGGGGGGGSIGTGATGGNAGPNSGVGSNGGIALNNTGAGGGGGGGAFSGTGGAGGAGGSGVIEIFYWKNVNP